MKKPELKIVDEVTYKKSLFKNPMTSRSTKKMTDYYNSEQFKSDMDESLAEAKACQNVSKIRKEFRELDVESSIMERERISTKESNICRKDFRILIVEDDKDIAFLLKECLNDLGFSEVDLACDGLKAIDRCKNREYDIVLSDYKMPHMDGLALWRYLSDTNYGATFIMISGFCDYQFKNLRKAGVFCIPKASVGCLKTIEKLAVGYYSRKLNDKMNEVNKR